ncbi:hypothetical protein M23134_02645 [Microscilla marina ATCC 23134]|uniref:Uncharacterized protein n=1 Tax=Microscilla marina ATCC 23134 TaxID=313606 RepID=A1ZNT7_MICM2|nr:hypothetical protein M23134_02645 [Microscilla marina ATCC 23134]
MSIIRFLNFVSYLSFSQRIRATPFHKYIPKFGFDSINGG